MEKINGIIIEDKAYKLSEGGCFKCDFFRNTLTGSCPVKEICTIIPYPNEEKDNCFRYSPEKTTHEHYGAVNTYPKAALKVSFAEFYPNIAF